VVTNSYQIMNHHGEEEFTTSGNIGGNHDFLRFVSTTAFTGLVRTRSRRRLKSNLNGTY
jgi:hypothetical protein